MRTGIIHIGAHKTGSTTIQTALWRSKEHLRLQGIHYFNDYDRKMQLLSIGFRKFECQSPPLQSKYSNAQEVRHASYTAWLNLSRMVRSNDQAFTIVSEEFLFRIQNLDRIKSLLDKVFDRTVIVVYIRNPLSNLPSGIDQRIRGGQTLNNLTKGRAGTPRILPKLENYANTFGSENLVVRNFDIMNLIEGSPENDFASILSTITDRNVLLEKVPRMNESLPAAVTAYLLRQNQARLNAGHEQTREDKQNRSRLIELVRSDPDLMLGPKLRLDDDLLISHVSAIFEDEVAKINQRFLQKQTKIEVVGNGNTLTRNDFRERLAKWIYSHEDIEGRSKRLAILDPAPSRW